MNYAILTGDDAGWGQAKVLGAMLERLGFTSCADAAVTPASARLLLVQWTSCGREMTAMPHHSALPADSLRFAVVPSDVSDSARAVLTEHFDDVLTAPVDEIALCNALAAQHYDALAPSERQSFCAKVLELACDDAGTARHLLQLILDTNRPTFTLLLDSFDAESWDMVGSAAHRIAGSARLLDCKALIALLIRLETATREREVALAKALLPLVVNALESLDVSVQEALGSVEQH
ncbi:Hpt domain-containing protein [Paraburkholderia fungorum]|uniref:Hpt domain-containing protein n=1 Tax=Paraburkholderia fungorum TaxID=134537 RepID=UPI0038B95A83